MANPIVQQINTELTALQKELGQFKETVDYLNNAKNSVKDAVIKVNHSEAHFNSKVEELKKTYNSFIKLTDSVSDVISKIDTINFPERLDSIEKTVKETITYLNETRKATLEELQKASEIITKADFDGRFKKLQNSIDTSVKSNDELAKSIEKQKLPEKIDGFEKNITKKLDNSLAELQKNTKQIAVETAKSIHDLNLPIRMDKLDANVAGIMAAIQNVQNRIESVEGNLGDKIKESSKKQTAMFATSHEKTIEVISELEAEMKMKFELHLKKQQTNNYITWALLVIGIVTIIILCKK